ncbi:recombinase family protein [Clostridium sp. D2Q-14]|uniref:recombinase family protein n=1 Tax=Anaeromonas gelatinilytica TaxID=2683194 RepID=UPI00193AF96B|nr:recombinase family protein [Anaeromonas gelatinilytica]MBS4535358.1 recombinase family protein [Anaeromonas gelatinilytica]
MDRVAIYLRKSRSDEEAEAHSDSETLSKHRKILLKVANNQNLNIIKIREEIVSGESMVHRPEMLELLKEVEDNMYDAVLCMDVDRLGRGNMQEQGLILDTFKKSNTRIITPRKIYDLKDEWDEEYSEFEAFMARKELKLINRRLQRGRIRSLEDGNYISPNPPYGYLIENDNNYRTLIPHPEQSEVVRLIFELYTKKGIGGSKIANKLNELGYKTYKNKKWFSSSVLNIIRNPVYSGKIIWKKKSIKKSTTPGKTKDVKQRPKNEWIIAEGKHKALISEEVFETAQRILKNKSHVPYRLENSIINPLAGLIKCQICGSSMILRPYPNKDDQIMCYNKCGNKSSKLKYIEKSMLNSLKTWLVEYQEQWENENLNKVNNNKVNVYIKALSNLKSELKETIKQKNNLHNLLERGIYDIDTYLERSEVIQNNIQKLEDNIKSTQKDIKQAQNRLKTQKDIIPKVENVLALYNKTKSPEKKNKLVKSVLEYAIYYKKKSQRNDEFTLTLTPKISDATNGR